MKGDALLIEKEALNRLAKVALNYDRFPVSAIGAAYADARDQREAERWFASDLLRCIEAAFKGEELMSNAIEAARFSPVPPIVIPKP